MEKEILSNQNPKATRIAVLLSDKAHTKSKLVRRDRKGHFILMKGAIHQEEKTIINKHWHNQFQ
jgi:hypothetical protein